MDDLFSVIHLSPLADTHEHLNSEQTFIEDGPDVLQDLFDNYITADLIVAGASPAAVAALIDHGNFDIEARLAGVASAWDRCQHTGYGEAVRLIARDVYALEEITVATIASAAERNQALRRPGGRLHLLRDVAKLDHVQIDDFTWPVAVDPIAPAFFRADISWVKFCEAQIDPAELVALTGVDVHNLASLRVAMEQIFARYGRQAVAVKSQHAYNRTLAWHPRSDASAAQSLDRLLAGDYLDEAARLCLGDWCLARGIELATAYNLPFKIHTGYHAGYGSMPIDWLRAGLLCGLLQTYPHARIILMHTAYPYTDELLALAKHYPNVYLDLCWAWSLDPLSTCEFVRRAIHTVPAHKLFVFGGDAFWPAASVAYAAQTRWYLAKALQAEITDGLLTERAAITLARRFMLANQRECFQLTPTTQLA